MGLSLLPLLASRSGPQMSNKRDLLARRVDSPLCRPDIWAQGEPPSNMSPVASKQWLPPVAPHSDPCSDSHELQMAAVVYEAVQIQEATSARSTRPAKRRISSRLSSRMCDSNGQPN